MQQKSILVAKADCLKTCLRFDYGDLTWRWARRNFVTKRNVVLDQETNIRVNVLIIQKSLSLLVVVIAKSHV